MKLYVAKDDNGVMCVFTHKPGVQGPLWDKRYFANEGSYAEIPELDNGELCEIELTLEDEK